MVNLVIGIGIGIYLYILVGDLEHECYFPPIVGMMIQSDELIFFRGVLNHQLGDG